MAVILGTSRFIQTPLTISRSGKTTYGRIEGFDNIKFIKEDNYIYYTVNNTRAGRPDLIAHDFYENVHLEWVIVLANAPQNPLNWPKAGDVIKLPKTSFIRSII